MTPRSADSLAAAASTSRGCRSTYSSSAQRKDASTSAPRWQHPRRAETPPDRPGVGDAPLAPALRAPPQAYNSEYLQTYTGHHMAVYTVRWNPFNVPPPSPTALPAETRHRVTPVPVAPGRRVSFSRAPLTGRSGCGITRGRRASSRSSSGIRRVGETLRRRLCHLHDRAATPRPPPAQVGDVAWTPWSSTTFAACTADGKVHLLAR